MKKLGTTFWWLKHEMRISWREMMIDYGSASVFIQSNLLFALYIALHGASYFLLKFGRNSSTEFSINLANIFTVAILTSIVVQGVRATYRTLIVRRDSEIFFVSRISMRKILLLRLLSISLTSVITPLFWISPLVNVQTLMGKTAAISLYPSILGLSFIVSSTIVILMYFLLLFFGRGAFYAILRTLLLCFLSMLVLFQLTDLSGKLEHWLSIMILPISWLADALYGNLLSSALLLLTGLCAVLFTSTIIDENFRFVLTNVAKDNKLKSTTISGRKKSSSVIRIFAKEWRVVLRDNALWPQLFISLCLTCIVMIVLLKSRNISFYVVLASSALYAGANLFSDLLWLMSSAESCPWLISTSPKPLRTHAIKFFAAFIPLFIIEIAISLFIGIGDFFLSVKLLILAMCCFAFIASLQFALSKPGHRRDVVFERRSRNRLLSISELFFIGCFVYLFHVQSVILSVGILFLLMTISTLVVVSKIKLRFATK